MSLLDLSEVTKTLIGLIKEHVSISPVLPGGVTVTVTPEPPDKLTGQNSIGLYLYHVAEDPANKNLPPMGSSRPAIRYTPMPLRLFYQLSTFSDIVTPSAAEGAYRAQLLMGCALKALHDYPVITDQTEMPRPDPQSPYPVMPSTLKDRDNRFHIELQPMESRDAVSYWTAGSSPLRLATYYQVSIVMLEPDTPVSVPPRVFAPQLGGFTWNTPRVEESYSTVSFTDPNSNTTHQLELRPAQVAIGETVTLKGHNLAGDDTQLSLYHSSWEQPVVLDPIAWQLQVSNQEVSLVMQEDLPGNVYLYPGTYEAFVHVTQSTPSPGAQLSSSVLKSNICPFVVVPSVSASDVSGTFEVTTKRLPMSFDNKEDVQIFVGDDVLKEVDQVGDLAAGKFFIESPTLLKFQLPTGYASQQKVPLRLFVNRVESHPYWITVP